MAKFDVDVKGVTYEVDAPDEKTAWAWANATHAKEAEPSLMQQGAQHLGNLAAGAVRGAGSIGSTILAPLDMAKDAMAGKGVSLESNRERRKAMDAALQTMGAEPDSWMYQGGKLGGEIAGTAGVGGVLAKGAQAAKATPALVESLRTGGMTANGAGMGTRALGGAATGAASAGLVDPESAALGGAVGGALPVGIKGAGMAGAAMGKALRGGEVAPEVKALADRAAQLGIDIPADRIANSRPMNALASGLNYVPFSGRAATEDAMNKQLAQALSRTYGQDSSNIAQSLRKAQTALGGKFDDVLQSNSVKVDEQLLSDLSERASQAAKELGSDGARIINGQIDEIMGKAVAGEIDGQAAYNIKKTLDRIGKRNSPEAHYAIDLKKDLMEALNRSLGADESKAFAKVRQQYGNMLTLEKLAKNGAEGDISIARVANLNGVRNPDLKELADIAAQFVKPREGQHGSMQRGMAAIGIGGTLGPAGLAGTAAAGRMANTLLNSQSARDFMLGKPGNQALANALRKATPLAYKTAPVLASQ